MRGYFNLLVLAALVAAVLLVPLATTGLVFFSSAETFEPSPGHAYHYRAWTSSVSDNTDFTLPYEVSRIERAVLKLYQVDQSTATSDVAYPYCASNNGGAADLYFNGNKLVSFTQGSGASSGQSFSGGSAGKFGQWGCCGCTYEHDVTSLLRAGTNNFYFQQKQITSNTGYTKLYKIEMILTLGASVTPTPSPAPTPTASPIPSPAPTATPSPAPTPTATPTPSPTATTTTSVPSSTAMPAATPTPSAAATPVMTPSATAAPTPSPAIVLTPTPAPSVTATPTPLPSDTAELVLAGGKALYYRAWLNTVSDKTAFTLSYPKASIKQAYLELRQVQGASATSDVPEPYCSSNKGGTAALYFNGAKIASFTQGSGASARQTFTGSAGKFGWWGCCGCLFRYDVTSLLTDSSNEFYFQQLATSLSGYTKIESARLVVSFTGTSVVAPTPSSTPRPSATVAPKPAITPSPTLRPTTATASPRPTVVPSPAPRATATPRAATLPSPTPTPSPSVAATTVPTVTVLPEPTAARPTLAAAASPVPKLQPSAIDFIAYEVECQSRDCEAASDLAFMQEVVPKIYSAVTQLWGFERKDKELKVKIVAGGPFSAALWEEDRKTLTVPALSKYDLNAQLGLPAEVSERDVLVAVLSHEMTHYVVNGWLLEKNVKQTSVPLWAREGMAALGEDKVTGLLGRQKVDKFMYAKRQDSDFSSRAFELKDKPGTLGLAFWNAYPADREANFYYGGAYSFYNYLYVKVFGGSYQSLLSLTEKLAWKDANSAFTGETGKSFSTVKEEWYASLRIPAVTPLPTPTPSPTPAPEKDCGWGLLGC